MTVKVTIIFAIALSSLLSLNYIEANIVSVEEACSSTQLPDDCIDSIQKHLDFSMDVTHNDILLAGLKLVGKRAQEGIDEIEKLKPQSQSIDAARLGMVQAYYKVVLARSKAAIESLNGSDFGSLEYELDGAVKTVYECQDLVPKDSPVQEYTENMHMGVKNNLSFGILVGNK